MLWKALGSGSAATGLIASRRDDMQKKRKARGLVFYLRISWWGTSPLSLAMAMSNKCTKNEMFYLNYSLIVRMAGLEWPIFWKSITTPTFH
jgi:hypothetical protein